MMDESKREQMRSMLSMLQVIVPNIKSLEQVEAEAAECDADPRSYCAGYFQGVRDGIDISKGIDRRFGGASSRATRTTRTTRTTIKALPREPRDITNLWGLIP